MIPSFSKIKHYTPWILTALLYAPVFYVLYSSRWKTSDYTHAYFILPVFLWLVWRKRGILREHLQKINPPLVHPFARGDTGGCENTFQPCPHETRPRGNWERGDGEKRFLQSNTISNIVGLFMLVFGASMFIFGWRQDYIFFKTLSLLPVLYGLISCLYGLKIAKVLSFPILYLLLLVPIPIGIIDSITLPMRYGVSVVTEGILKLFHYPITREGLLLSIGNSELFIGQPCSGFRSLITMFSAGLVYVFISKTRFPQKSMLVASIIPLALLGNLFRIIILCLITYYFGEAAGQGFFHNFSGIMMVVLITLGLIGLEYCLGKRTPNTSPLPLSPPNGGRLGEELSPAGGGAGGGNIPRPHSPPHGMGQGEEPFFPRPLWEGLGEGDELTRNKSYINKKVYVTNAVLLFTIIFCFGFSGTNTIKTKYVSQDILSRLEIPYEINGWQGRDIEQEWNLENVTNYHQIFEREYVNKEGKNLFLLILDADNFHHPKVCARGGGFKVKELNGTEFHVLNRTVKAHTLYVEKDTDGFLVSYWVSIDGNITDWTEQKIKQLWFALTNKESTGLMIRLDIPCKEDGIENALQIAQSFVTDLGKAIPSEGADYIFGKINL